MTPSCNFISLGEKRRELLDAKGKQKKTIIDHMIGQKCAKFARCVAVFLGEAE